MKNHSFKNSLRKFVANDLISAMCYWKLHFNEHIIFKSKLIISYEKRINNNQVKHKSKIVGFWEPDTRMFSGSSFGSYTFPELEFFVSKWMLRKNAKTQTVIKCERASFFFSGHRTILAVDLRKHFIRKTCLECLSNTAR